MIWIVGEYCDRIDNADELLDSFMDSFGDEDVQVQLQLLTSTVKLFLKRPKGNQELVQKVLGLCTQECDDPDLRDRGYIYWRLLLTDPEAAKAVVLCEKPLISEETDMIEPSTATSPSFFSVAVVVLGGGAFPTPCQAPHHPARAV